MLLGAYAFMFTPFHVKCSSSLLVIVFVLKMTSLDIITAIQSHLLIVFMMYLFLSTFNQCFYI